LAIHSVPRSGSTWLGELFNSHPNVVYAYQPMFSYAFRERLTLHSSSEDIDMFFKDLEKTKDEFINQIDARKAGKLPVFKNKEECKAIVYKEVRFHHLIKHLLVTSKDLKLVGLVRNPLAVINSWFNAPREFRKDLDWQIDEEWQFAPKKNLYKDEEFFGYEKWKEVADLFLKVEKKYPNRFRLVKYSDLMEDTEEVIKNLFSFVGLDMNNNTIEFIKQSKQKNIDDTYSVYRTQQVDDKWKTQLKSNIVDYITYDLKDTELEKFLW
jgi:hypothetical protein